MTGSEVKDLLNGLKNISIAVIGDFFLDKYLEMDGEKKELSVVTGLEAFLVTGKRLFRKNVNDGHTHRFSPCLANY